MADVFYAAEFCDGSAVAELNGTEWAAITEPITALELWHGDTKLARLSGYHEYWQSTEAVAKCSLKADGSAVKMVVGEATDTAKIIAGRRTEGEWAVVRVAVEDGTVEISGDMPEGYRPEDSRRGVR